MRSMLMLLFLFFLFWFVGRLVETLPSPAFSADDFPLGLGEGNCLVIGSRWFWKVLVFHFFRDVCLFFPLVVFRVFLSLMFFFDV